MKLIVGVFIAVGAIVAIVYFVGGGTQKEAVSEDLAREVNKVKDSVQDEVVDMADVASEARDNIEVNAESAVETVKGSVVKTSELILQTVEGVDVAVDEKNNLMWVNSLSGCKIHKEGEAAALTAGAKHCSSLEYAGKSDWRLATGKEMSNLIVAADKEDFALNYINPNCQFMTVQTGFVQTAKNKEIGKVQDTTNGGPSGFRCVRSVE
jgi:hypothetical protein